MLSGLCNENYVLLRLSENAHLPFGRLTALSKAEGPFDKLMALSKVEASKGCVTLIPRPVKFSLRETAKPI
jgi:hypothetical protein